MYRCGVGNNRRKALPTNVTQLGNSHDKPRPACDPASLMHDVLKCAQEHKQHLASWNQAGW